MYNPGKLVYIWFKRLIIHSVQHGYFTFTHVAGLYIIVDKCSLLPYKVNLIPNYKFLCSTHMCKDIIVGKIVQIYL